MTMSGLFCLKNVNGLAHTYILIKVDVTLLKRIPSCSKFMTRSIYNFNGVRDSHNTNTNTKVKIA